jgi:hypothetical protein
MNYRRFRKLSEYYKIYGFSFFIGYCVNQVLKRLTIPTEVNLLRYKIGREIFESCGGEVIDGPFRGLKLKEDISWGALDIASMLLGNYELNVQKRISSVVHQQQKIFIDLGAADGFFACGCAAFFDFKKVISFEINPKSRKVQAEIAKLNNIKNLEIRAEINKQILIDLLSNTEQKCVFLIDLEGFETDLLDNDVLQLMQGHELIVELHEMNGELVGLTAKLIERLKMFFLVDEFRCDLTLPLSGKNLLTSSNNEFLLSVSEGRPSSDMRWVYCK